MRFKFLKNSFSKMITTDIAIDLGTSTTLIYVKGQGIVLNEPSVVALDNKTNRPIVFGKKAKNMLGKTPDKIRAVRPMKDGVIADFEVVEHMLRGFISKSIKRRSLLKPKIIVCVPSGITAVEMRAVRDSVEHAGARDVYLVSEPISASIGVGLPVEEASGNMIIDIGGGTTEIAVISLSGIVSNSSIRVAGDEMDNAIVLYIKKKYNLLIGDQTAEMVKINIGSAYSLEDETSMSVKGVDLVKGIPKTIDTNSKEMREALKEPVSMIVEALKLTLEKTPPELASDIVDRGIYMAGGGSLLHGLGDLIKAETDLVIKSVNDPIECVVLGAGKILDNLSKYEKLLMKSKRE